MPAPPSDLRDRWLERLPAPVWVVDADDRTVAVNPALVETLGCPAEEIVGRSPAEFLTEESQATYRAQSILRRSGLADSVNLTLRTKSGELRDVRVTGAPIFEGDQYVGKVAILRDVAIWNAVENAVREANQEVIADLAAGARETRERSHELRPPLEAILGSAERLLRGGAGPLAAAQAEEAGRIVRAARDALDRLAGLEGATAPGPRQGD